MEESKCGRVEMMLVKRAQGGKMTAPCAHRKRKYQLSNCQTQKVSPIFCFDKML